MKHVEGDVVKPRDCIVLASGHRKRDLPFIAKVTSLWENPEDGKSDLHHEDNIHLINCITKSAKH